MVPLYGKTRWMRARQNLQQRVYRNDVGANRRAESLVARIHDYRHGEEDQRILGHRLRVGRLANSRPEVPYYTHESTLTP